MIDWHPIWERKGREDTADLIRLDGFEDTDINPREVAKKIVALLGMKQDTTVLEVGCGAGMLAVNLIPFCGEYTGIDYSESLVAKHRDLIPKDSRTRRVVTGNADQLPYGDDEFDCVIAYSVFHYFPSNEYALQAIREMERVARKAVFVGDVPLKSHRYKEWHRLYTRGEFMLRGYEVTEGCYNPDRIDAYRILRKKL